MVNVNPAAVSRTQGIRRRKLSQKDWAYKVKETLSKAELRTMLQNAVQNTAMLPIKKDK